MHASSARASFPIGQGRVDHQAEHGRTIPLADLGSGKWQAANGATFTWALIWQARWFARRDWTAAWLGLVPAGSRLETAPSSVKSRSAAIATCASCSCPRRSSKAGARAAADRATHAKIVAISLPASVAFGVIGMMAHSPARLCERPHPGRRPGLRRSNRQHVDSWDRLR